VLLNRKKHIWFQRPRVGTISTSCVCIVLFIGSVNFHNACSGLDAHDSSSKKVKTKLK